MPRIVQTLNGSDWKFQSFADGTGIREIFESTSYDFSTWMPATVPGNVRLDLMRNNKISDPLYGKNNLESQWVADFEWWYHKEFEISSSDRLNKVLHLICKAVDYYAEFWLNGTLLGAHEGMFGEISFDITELIQDKNVLLIRLAAMKNYPDRFKVIKCQMSYGWDWAPKMVPSGIWDDIFITIKEKIYIESCYVRANLENEPEPFATLKITVDLLNQLDPSPIHIITRIEGKNFESEPIIKESEQNLKNGMNNINWEIKLNNPMLWYPWDKGKPNLYTCRINIKQEDKELDIFEDTLGIRKFQLLSQEIDPSYYPWIFEINGEREYIRGGNWVPSDMLFGRLDRVRYEKNIKLAKEANLNLVRIWGGGLKEKDDFYKVCDEEGILVWQEFPLACIFTNTLPKDEKYLSILKNEAESIVKAIRNHPSLLLWCGGNEFHSGSNAHAIKVLQDAVETYDERIFIPASPEGGDNHNYAVFHGMGPYQLYLEDNFPMVSEFGLSSFPNFSTLAKLVPEDELYFWSKTINYRAPHVIFFQGHKLRIQRYAIPFFPTDELKSIIKATQQGQGLGLKTAIEHYRRRKLNWQNAGCAFWQVNQPWPCISWCIYEYDYEKKLSFEYVRIAFQPVLISLKYNLEIDFNKKDKSGNFFHKNFEADVFLINDYSREIPNCKLEISFLAQDNSILTTIERTIDVPDNSCIQLEPISYEFPHNLVHPPKIRIKLLSNNKILTKNFYNLRYRDPIQNKTMGRLMKRSSDILMFDKSSRLARLLKTGALALRIIPHFIYLGLKTRIKWRRRSKDEFEYESRDFF